MTGPTQAELDQPDPVGGTAILGDVDTAGNPVEVAEDQAPVSRYAWHAIDTTQHLEPGPEPQ